MGQDVRRLQAEQVYINSGWSEISPTHTHVRDIQTRGRTHTLIRVEKWPGQCSIDGRETIKPTGCFCAAHQAAAENRAPPAPNADLRCTTLDFLEK